MKASPNPANVPTIDNTLVLDPAAVTEFTMRIGFRKTHIPLLKTTVLGILAGIYVTFGCQTMVAILVDSGSTGPAKLLGGAFFALALMCIIHIGAELFTGNVMILVAVLARRVFVWEYVFNLVFVYLLNFLGSIVFAIVFWGTGVNGFEGAYTAAGTILCKTALTKATLPHYQAFLRGVGANMCVCFAILMSYASKTPSGKMLSCVFPIASFVAMGFEHSIANMYFYSAATLLRCPGVTQHDMWAELMLCTAGNVVGAMLLAGAYYVANVRGTKLELEEVPREVLGVPVHSSGGLKFMPASGDEPSIFAASSVNNASFAIEMPVVVAARARQQMQVVPSGSEPISSDDVTDVDVRPLVHRRESCAAFPDAAAQ